MLCRGAVGNIVESKSKTARALVVDAGVVSELVKAHLELDREPSYRGYLGTDAI